MEAINFAGGFAAGGFLAVFLMGLLIFTLEGR
jgi:hypothetical protein